MNAIDGWISTTLGDSCKIEIGGTPSRSTPGFWDTSRSTKNLWVSIRDLNQSVIYETNEYISDDGVKQSNVKIQKTGTILLSFKLTIGKVAYAGTDLYTNEAIAGLQPHEIHADFLYQGLQYWDLLLGVDQAIKGATLNKAKLKEIVFQHPISHKEQAQIATILSTIDKAIEQTEAIIAKQQRIKTGLMQDLLTHGIDEAGNIRSEATHEFKDSPLGRIPVEWEVVKLGETITSPNSGKLQTGPFGSQLHSHEYVDEGIPVVMPQDITPERISTLNIARITEYKAQELQRHIVKVGDILFARRGDLSRCVQITEREAGWICGTGCLLMRTPIDVISPWWISTIYQFHTTQKQVNVNAVGSTMVNLNTTILSNLLISLPRISEQYRIEEALNKIQSAYQQSLYQHQKLIKVKTGLMQDLLTGKVRVTDLLTPSNN